MALTPSTYTNYVEQNWPGWKKWCTHPDPDVVGGTAAELLLKAVTKACNLWNNFRDDEDADMTNPMKDHLLNLIKKFCFDYHHGDTEFKNPPQIIQDFLDVKEKLEKGLIGTGNVTVTAKDRIFDEGFTDSEDLWYNQ